MILQARNVRKLRYSFASIVTVLVRKSGWFYIKAKRFSVQLIETALVLRALQLKNIFIFKL